MFDRRAARIISVIFLAVVLCLAAVTQVDWVTQIKNKPIIDAREYNFTPQSLSGSISVGSNTKTMTPCPLGWSGSASNLYAYLSGGTGTAESVLITGGTCTSGAASGTVIFTAAHTHSGAYKISSATAGIQEALLSLPVYGGTVQVANGLSTIQAKITIPGSGYVPRIGIIGTGGILERGAAYPSGDLIYLDGTLATAAVTIKDLEFNAAGPYGSWLNVTAGAAIHLYNSSGSKHVIEDCRINDGFFGVQIDGTQQVTVRNLYYSQQNMSPVTAPIAGILINGVSSLNLPPTSIHITGGVVTTNGFTSANGITAGILIQNGDGVLIDSIQIGGGPANGVLIQGINGSLIANTYIDHILIDSVRSYGIRAYQSAGTAAFFGGITISNSHINAQNYILPANSSVDGIRLETGTGWLIENNQIGNWGANGIQLLSAGAINGVSIVGNKLYDNNYSNASSISGININTTGSADLLIANNDIRNLAGTGHQKYGIAFLGATSKAVVSGNALSGNVTGTVLMSAVPTELAMAANEGWTNNVPAVASGASIAAPMADTFTVTGTTQVTTITGGWAGRVITLIFTDASPGGVGTGGNIGRVQSAAQNQSIRLSSNGTNWY